MRGGGAQLHSIAFGGVFLISQNLYRMLKILQNVRIYPPKVIIHTKIVEFLLTRIGFPKNGYLRVFCQMSRVAGRAVENAESTRSVIYAIFSAHSAYFNVSRQKVPYFNVSRQNRVVFKTVLQQNNVEAC